MSGKIQTDWLKGVRQHASEAFTRMAWPTRQHEEWRRTSLEDILLDSYAPSAGGAALRPPPDDGPGAILTFSDGNVVHYRSDADLEEHGGGFFRYPLDPIVGEQAPAAIRIAINQLEEEARHPDNRFIAWNLSAWTAGAILYVPEGVRLSEPVIIEYGDPGHGRLFSTHTVVVLAPNASATVVQRYTGSGDSDVLWNSGVTAFVGEGARCVLSNSQMVASGHRFFQHISAHVARDARLDTFDAVLGGRLSKTRSAVYLDGPGAEAYLNGIYFAQAGQHIDAKTVQYHRDRAGQSRAIYKGAVAEGGRSIYQGLIDVDHEASGTDAYLTNKNLILGDGARADSIPCLEIRTNDVKCSHGSTSGRIDENELFYLMSRGISREDARRELIVGYFEEQIQKAPGIEQESIRDRIRQILDG